jgi:hypothetical protein
VAGLGEKQNNPTILCRIDRYANKEMLRIIYATIYGVSGSKV